MHIRSLKSQYLFRIAVSLLWAVVTGTLWMAVWTNRGSSHTYDTLLFWAVVATLALFVLVYWQYGLYRAHTRKVLFLLEALENDDASVHFVETEANRDNRLVSQALNKVAQILYKVKNETAQQEKYYELILECVNTGILVLNDNGAVYQKNSEALRLLGMEVFTHVRQLERVDSHLMEVVTACRPSDKLQAVFSNERGTVNLSIRVSDIHVHQEHLRILALNDINNELDEKEVDSWIRLTRVLTHEIMNAVTPITSLSDTLLTLMNEGEVAMDASDRSASQEEIRNGLQTISSTGKGLLSFVENYRRFTRIPTPEPSLFYVKAFLQRMVDLTRHQHAEAHVVYQLEVVPDNLILYADESLVSQVVINLLKNAIQAIESGVCTGSEGRICLRAYCNEAEAVLIEISNNGPAIPADIAEHIFIPFFTTKEGGSGIGLSISRQIMRLSGGSITLLPKGETTFVLKFN